MSRIQERMKLRREYLKQKGKALTCLAVDTGVFVFGRIAAILAGIVAAFAIAVCFYLMMTKDTLSFVAIRIFNSAVLVSLFCALISFIGKRLRESSKMAVTRLSHVPPVTVDTLPAEELLVRGSERPQQEQSTVLVRPAAPEQEAPAEQLLRVTDREPLG